MTLQLLASAVSVGVGLVYIGLLILLYERNRFSTANAQLLGWICLIGVIISVFLVASNSDSDSIITDSLALGWLLLQIASFLPLMHLLSGGPGKSWWWAFGGALLIGIYVFLPADKNALFMLTSLAALLGSAALLMASRSDNCQPIDIWRLWMSCALLLAGSVSAVYMTPPFSQVFITLATFLISGFVSEPRPVFERTSFRTLREFNNGISNISNPELLATVAIGLICKAVGISRGFIFSVENESGARRNYYRLKNLGGMGQLDPDAIEILVNSATPVFQTLQKDRRHLLMCDVQASPDFLKLSEGERAWFYKLQMGLFIPVHAREDWIGLICLEAKQGKRGYSMQELDLASTLADQLSLSLQNARLVDSLMRVNNDFRRAYTSMEQSNRQLQQAVFQLEKMDQTKSDFISVSSHELRTPLTVIRGYAEMLLEDTGIKNNVYQQKMLNGIHAGIMRLHEIVDSMLDIASIDSQTLNLSKHPTSVYHLINSVCTTLKSSFEERAIKLELENLRDLPMIDVDAEKMSKVFYQLITNAIKFTPDSGTVTISGVAVSPGQMGYPQGAVEVVIADTGIGIEPANLELIFRKFYQTGEVSLHSSGKTKFKGSGPGLGLAIAKGIVDAHGGQIWAESRGLDERTTPGSQFHVIIPLSREQTAVEE